MKKVLALLVALVMVGMMGTALAEGKLVVGTNAEFAPFEYIDDDGKYAGFDIDLIDAIMKLVGVEYEVISIEFDALLPALASGQINLSISGMTINEERAQNVLFSEPYFNASQKLMVVEGSAITCAADLKEGMKIGVQMGTTGDLYATDNLPVEVVRYNKILDAILDMKNGRLDAVMTDAAPSDYYAKAAGGLTVLPEELSEEKYGIAVKLDNTELIEKINAALAQLVEDGTYETIHAKYFTPAEE